MLCKCSYNIEFDEAVYLPLCSSCGSHPHSNRLLWNSCLISTFRHSCLRMFILYDRAIDTAGLKIHTGLECEIPFEYYTRFSSSYTFHKSLRIYIRHVHSFFFFLNTRWRLLVIVLETTFTWKNIIQHIVKLLCPLTSLLVFVLQRENLRGYCVPCFWEFNKSYSMCWFPPCKSYAKLCDLYIVVPARCFIKFLQ
jgi:hypothetical protein